MPTARERQRAPTRDVVHEATPAAVRAHTEAPADPAAHAPRRNATVGDDRERLDDAKWPVSTRWRANRRTPLAAAPTHVAAPCFPRRACTGDVVDPTTPLTDLQCPYKPAPVAPCAHARFHPSRRRCEPHSSRLPHSPKHLGSPLCLTKPSRASY
jgi:hypothetical protein